MVVRTLERRLGAARWRTRRQTKAELCLDQIRILGAERRGRFSLIILALQQVFSLVLLELLLVSLIVVVATV